MKKPTAAQEKARHAAVIWTAQAQVDLARGDRIDALDALQRAHHELRASMPPELVNYLPKVLNVGKNRRTPNKITVELDAPLATPLHVRMVAYQLRQLVKS